MTQAKPFIRILLSATVAILTFVFFAQKIVFVNADLGRHLENGKVFFQNHSLVSTNYYSYTEPDRPVVNHHWGSGVLLYIIYKIIGFKGLSVFYCLISSLTVLIFYLIAEKRSPGFLAFLFFMICIPVIASRVEIRPELFSMFFLGIYVYLFDRYKSGKLEFKKLLISIPILQLLWVNLHLFFVMGLLLTIIYGIQDLISKNRSSPIKTCKNFGMLLGFSLLACLINPAGIYGALVPLTIFRNYAYMIAENQGLLFMQNRFNLPVYIHFELIVLLLLILAFFLVYKRKSGMNSALRGLKSSFSEMICLLVFCALAFKAIRGIPVAGYFILAFAPVLSADFINGLLPRVQKRFFRVAAFGSLLLFLVSIFKSDSYLSAFKEQSGFGLYTELNNSARFFKSLQLEGPVFNNYDIGGYLILGLFPRERVFVDNRPEAYSKEFFEQVYNPMLEKEEVWAREDSIYRFNCIYFYRLDATPFGQPFLIRRLADRDNWAPVYVDRATIIFLKRNEKNKAVIKQYELPPDLFVSKQNPR